MRFFCFSPILLVNFKLQVQYFRSQFAKMVANLPKWQNCMAFSMIIAANLAKWIQVGVKFGKFA
jgi:hypothetical protein